MGLGVTLYALVLVTWLGWRTLHGSRPTLLSSCVAALATAVLVMLILALCPRVVSSVWARFLHLPEDVVWFLLRARPFTHNLIEPGIVLGRLPRTPADLDTLQELYGVSAIIALSEPWELYMTPEEIRREGHIDVLCLPTPDYTAPSPEDVQRGVEFLEDALARNKTVYVHCNGGKGRSSVVVMAYLMKAKGLSKEQAFDYVSSKRPIAPMQRWNGWLPQWRALTAWETEIKRT